MRFAAPELFALIALALLLAWLLWRAGRAPRPRFLFPHAPPAAADPGVRGRAARWLPALRVAAAICAIAAIARPQATTVEALEPAGGIDIVLAIDASSSMTRHALGRRRGDAAGRGAAGGAGSSSRSAATTASAWSCSSAARSCSARSRSTSTRSTR